MKYSILLLVLFSGCATVESAVVGISALTRKTIDGMAQRSTIIVKNQSRLTEGEATILVEYYVSQMPKPEYLMGYTIVLVDGWMKFKNPNDPREIWVADGLTMLDKNLMFISVHDCFFDSSLYHEYMHIWQLYELDKVDQQHEDKKFWREVKKHSQSIVDNMCPKEYVRERTK